MVLATIAGLAGLGVGRGLSWWIGRLTPEQWSLAGVNVMRGWRIVVELGTAGLFAAFVVAYLEWECQQTPVVRPEEFWRYGRIVSHLILISLLIAATGTDFRDYVIPDQITLAGVLIGVAGAVLSGDLQIVHLWIDWNAEIPGYEGPFIPEWIRQHHHWHGLAWSLAGLAAGAGVTWLVRLLSSLLLGQPAMGAGDVTLMAMIGSFLGWQPVAFVLLLAPPCGLAVGLTVRLTTRRRFVPFGPYLAAATVVVLFSWRWLWMFEFPWTAQQTFSVRRLFGDWQSLVILAGIALAAFVVLLGLLRLYRGIPVPKRESND
ncbi:MAG: prepilin peptidase [Planctomycetaceae bacterium]